MSQRPGASILGGPGARPQYFSKGVMHQSGLSGGSMVKYALREQ